MLKIFFHFLLSHNDDLLTIIYCIFYLLYFFEYFILVCWNTVFFSIKSITNTSNFGVYVGT